MEYSVTNVHVDTARGRFAVRAVGNPGGRMVLAIHGFADHPATFDGLGQYLAGQGYVTVAPYLRGHAPSPMGPSASVADHAQDLLALVQELAPDDSARVVGHGEGSWVVHQALLEQARAGVKDQAGAATIDCAVTLGMPAPGVVRYLMQRHPSVAWSMRHVLMPRAGAWGARRIERDDFTYLTDLWRRWSPTYQLSHSHSHLIRSMYAQSMPTALGLLELPDASSTQGWPDARILCILGEWDGAIPPYMLPGRHVAPDTGNRVVLPSVGHFPHLEAPDVTYETIAGWFVGQQVSTGRSAYV
ncbi:MAG: alpha/beta hydrolase [Kocuria sp.]|nr:alpha/beta hydrolase [Kocuria sp.]